MTDHDALIRAVCDHPDDDTPRLIYADFLEENGEPERAMFVRAQVQVANVPPWEPLAVEAKHRQTVYTNGLPFLATLPDLAAGWQMLWDSEAPFRRGFGWRVHLHSLLIWNEHAADLLRLAPIGALHVRAQDTLDDWRRFATAETAMALRVLHLEGGSPTEPVRALWESRQPLNLTDLYLHRASSQGLSFTVTDLLASPIGQRLRGLHFRMGYEALEHLIEALTPDSSGYERLTLAVMGLTPNLIREWVVRGGVQGLNELDLRQNYQLGNDGVLALLTGAQPGLHTLGLAEIRMARQGLESLAACPALITLRKLDISSNTFEPRAIRALARSTYLAGLRSLNLARCQIGDQAIRRLVGATFWPNLVELDLRGNPITDPGINFLLRAPMPPDLTALLIDGSRISGSVRGALHRHYGNRVLLAP